MKTRFTIGRKIGFGFGILLVLTFIVFFLTNNTLRKSRTVNERIIHVYNPSIAALETLKSAILRTRMLITNWAFVQSREDADEKLVLNHITNEEIPQMKRYIDRYATKWDPKQQEQKKKIYKDLDELLGMYETVKKALPDMRSYDDPTARFMARDYAEDSGEIDVKAKQIISELNILSNSQRDEAKKDSETMVQSFNVLNTYIRYFGFVLILGGVLIAIYTARSIVLLVQELKRVIEKLSRGVFPEHMPKNGNDEIGEMTEALSQLVVGLRQTTEFSRQVGSGNFKVEYNALSDEDALGKALLKMRDDLRENQRMLRENERDLEQKVEARTAEVVSQKEEIERKNQALSDQKTTIEKKNRRLTELYTNITDSIKYAKRLQENILPHENQIKAVFPEYFIFYKPRDIVSGDFYYLRKVQNKVIISVVDCTGHGVPGAFISLVGHNSLDEAIKQNKDLEPGKILSSLSKIAAQTLNKTTEDNSVHDGMDLGLCVLDLESRKLKFAGAYNPLYVIRKSKPTEIEICKADKLPVGNLENNGKYTQHEMTLKKGDRFYLFSDGYVDQFGGEKGRKLMYNRFRQLLLDVQSNPMKKQGELVENYLRSWKKGHEQVDDILLMGIEIS